jgi:hypothetical protein
LTWANVPPTNKEKYIKAQLPSLPNREKREINLQKWMIIVDEFSHSVPLLLSAHNKTSAKGMAN